MNGFSSASLLVMLNVAVRVPDADGSKVTVNVVLSEAFISNAGCTFTVKSAALVPLTVTLESVKFPVP